MKKQLLVFLTLTLAGVFTLNSMQENYTLHFKLLGIKPDTKLTHDKINTAYDISKKRLDKNDKYYSSDLIRLATAKNKITLLCSAREDRQAKHHKKINSRVNTGIFTQQIIYEEQVLAHGLHCTYQVGSYNYKRILSALGLFGAATVGLTYWCRNELSSLVNPIFNAVFLKSKA